jgi:hypothetical protein
MTRLLAIAVLGLMMAPAGVPSARAEDPLPVEEPSPEPPAPAPPSAPRAPAPPPGALPLTPGAPAQVDAGAAAGAGAEAEAEPARARAQGADGDGPSGEGAEPEAPAQGAASEGGPVAPGARPAMGTQARAASPATRPPGRPRGVDRSDGKLTKKESALLGGRHWRIQTAQGAVHVWVPPGYRRETAGTVVYVHGYYTDADGAWRDHQLARQFKASQQNAMFIVPDAPAGNEQRVRWPALTDLRRAVTRANLRLPDGPIVVMGHSGAFRTVMQWVDHRHIGQIILLDALYAGESAFDEFIHSGKRADEHKLIVVGAGTAQDSAGFAKKYRFARARERVPSSVGGFTKAERRARLLYIHSQYDHMSIVTSGKVIPVLLRLTRLRSL